MATELNIKAYFSIESDLEAKIVASPKFRDGLFWGKPRIGHPEGKVIYHIREVLQNIDKISSISPSVRAQLRIITFVHDTFKCIEDTTCPRDWSKHHSVYAREYLREFTNDKSVLDVVELHDEAYYCWKHNILQLYNKVQYNCLLKLKNRLGENLQLFYLFFKCDTQTGDKTQAPIKWFEKNMEGIEMVNF